MMRKNCLKSTLVLTACIFVTGCQTVPVVPHAINCDVSPELLSGKCAAPKPIPNDATYATLVDTMQTDRQALRECGITIDALRDSLRRCKDATDEFNKTIDNRNSAK